MKRKHHVELNRQERRLAFDGLNRFRNKLIAAGRYTDAVDELMLRLVNAKPQKHRMWGDGGHHRNIEDRPNGMGQANEQYMKSRSGGCKQ